MRQFILFILLAFTLSANADCPQQPNKKPDFQSIVEKRFCVIAHELCLDESKANQVRPLYFEYCKKMGELLKPKGPKKPMDQRTDAEIEQDVKANFAKAKSIVQLRETYYNKLRKLLTPKQIVKIYEIEQAEQRKFRQHNAQRNNNKK